MKKFKTIMMAMVAMAAMTFSFTSCDDEPWDRPDDGPNDGWYRPGDDGNDKVTIYDEADALCGEWFGPVKYTYNNGNGGYDVAEFYATMRFSRYNTNSAKGTGTEIDKVYDESGNVKDSQTLTFTWEILSNYDIQITYDDGGTYVLDANASQKGFSLGKDDKTGKNVFAGYMIGTGSAEGNEIAFNFEATNKNGTRAAGSSAMGNTFGINSEKPVINVAAGGKLSKTR